MHFTLLPPLPPQMQEPGAPLEAPEMDGWIACDVCKQWRKVSIAYAQQAEAENLSFVCNMLPGVDCSMISEHGVVEDD